MFHSECQLMTKPNIIVYLELPLFKVGSNNESPKHWIGINPKTAPNDLLQELTRNSYEIVKAKYTKK